MATPGPIPYYILCRDEARREAWQARMPEVPGIAFRLRSGYSSMYAFVTEAIREAREPVLVVAHDDVVVGRGFAPRLQSLVADLDASFPTWGLASNAGVGSDGLGRHVYVKDPWCRPDRGRGPQPVICVDGNLMLVNKANFLAAGAAYPDLGGFHGYDLVLSFECLRAGLLVLADSRLGAVHLSGGSRGIYQQYMKSTVFQDYFRTRFADEAIPSMPGLHPVEPIAGLAPDRPLLQAMFDEALVRSLTGRRHRLAIVSFGTPAEDAAARVAGAIEGLALATVFDVDFVSLPTPGDGAESLSGAVQASVKRLDHDHLWFVPPGSHVEPSALSEVMRAIACQPGALIVGQYEQSAAAGGSNSVDPPGQANFASALFGAGHFPLAALVFPSAPLREASARPGFERAFGDGVLMGALTLVAAGATMVHLRQTLAVVPASAPAPSPAGAYGSGEDWEYADRVQMLDIIVARTSTALWDIAERQGLATPASSWMRRASDVEQFAAAVRKVLRQPSKYLWRGFSLGVSYLVRGDIRGLAREARLFRPRG